MFLVLPTPDVALYTEPGASLVPIPHLIGTARANNAETARVRFEGDELETEFAGEGFTVEAALTARFAHTEHVEYLALVSLLRRASRAPDRRLVLRTNTGTIGGLDPLLVCTVPSFTETGLRRRGWDVSFTASAVKG